VLLRCWGRVWGWDNSFVAKLLAAIRSVARMSIRLMYKIYGIRQKNGYDYFVTTVVLSTTTVESEDFPLPLK